MTQYKMPFKIARRINFLQMTQVRMEVLAIAIWKAHQSLKRTMSARTAIKYLKGISLHSKDKTTCCYSTSPSCLAAYKIQSPLKLAKRKNFKVWMKTLNQRIASLKTRRSMTRKANWIAKVFKVRPMIMICVSQILTKFRMI